MIDKTPAQQHTLIANENTINAQRWLVSSTSALLLRVCNAMDTSTR